MLGVGNAITSGSTTSDLLTMTTDLELWLKNGSGVSGTQWTDSSGNNNHATQGTGDNQATASGGGLDFEEDNSDHYDLASDITIAKNGGFACAWVMDLESATQNTILSDSNDETIQVKTTSIIRIYTNDDSETTTELEAVSGTPFGSSKMLLLLNRTAGGSGVFTVYKNGVNIPVGDGTNATAGDNIMGFDVDTLGSRGGSGVGFFDGILYEVAFWSKSLSAQEISDVNDYLTTVHGL